MNKRENKKNIQFTFNKDIMKKISDLKNFYETKNPSTTIEEAIKRTAQRMEIEVDEIIRNENDLLNFYRKTAVKGQIISVVETVDKVPLSKNTIQRYRKKLLDTNKLRKVKRLLYIVEGDK